MTKAYFCKWDSPKRGKSRCEVKEHRGSRVWIQLQWLQSSLRCTEAHTRVREKGKSKEFMISLGPKTQGKEKAKTAVGNGCNFSEGRLTRSDRTHKDTFFNSVQLKHQKARLSKAGSKWSLWAPSVQVLSTHFNSIQPYPTKTRFSWRWHYHKEW